MANDFFVGSISGDASAAGNYSAPNLPVNADNLYFGALGINTVAVTAGFSALAGVSLGTLSFASTYTGTVGLGPQVVYNVTAGSRTGAGPYTTVVTTNVAHGYSVGDTIVVAGVTPSAYNATAVVTAVTSTTFTYSLVGDPGAYTSGGTAQRLAQFQVGATTCRIGDVSLSGSSGTGSTRLNLDFLSSAVACTVIGTYSGVGSDGSLEPVRLKFNSASASLNVESGRVGIATTTLADTSTLGTINVSTNSAILDIGAGVTFTTLQNNGGTVNLYCGGGTSYIYNGQLNLLGNVLLTNVYAYGGTTALNVRPSSGAAVTNMYMRGGTLDLTGNPAPLTITNIFFRDGQIKQAYAGQLTVTNWTTDLTDRLNFTGNRA